MLSIWASVKVRDCCSEVELADEGVHDMDPNRLVQEVFGLCTMPFGTAVRGRQKEGYESVWKAFV